MSKPKYVVLDMETNGLLHDVTEIHCIVLRIPGLKGEYVYSKTPIKGAPHDGGIMTGVQHLQELVEHKGYTVVGHNILGYDFPVLKKFGHWYPDVFNSDHRILDTYIGVSLRYPKEKPGLEHWGQKIGVPKPAHEDWTTLSADMIHRCVMDTRINDGVLKILWSDGYGDPKWEQACALEQEVLWVHSQQVVHGMRVDIMEARRLLNRIDAEIRRLTVILHRKLPQTCVNQGELKSIFKQDGNLTHHVENWAKDKTFSVHSAITFPPGFDPQFVNSKGAIRIGGPFSRIDFEPVNLNSHPKVKALLLSLGWKPRKYNFKKDKSGQFERDEKGQLIPTTPKLTEDSYDSLPPGLGQEIAELLKLKHRRRFIQNESNPRKGLIGFIRDDARVECEAFTCGTNTGRYRHSGAFVNLPKVSTKWGPEIRSLFCVPGDRYLIGIDLDGIEARMMGHYASFYDGGSFADEVLKGDVHQMTGDVMGIDRELAKTFRYAISYGAGVGKLKEILKCNDRTAASYIRAFWRANPGLAKLIEMLEQQYARDGYITGIDGRELYIRHKHKLFNTLIQNAATVVFKKWMVLCHQIKGPDVEVHQVLAYHDELGFEVYCDEEFIAAKWGDYLADQARIIGEDMNLNVPISAEAKVGKRYNEVH